MLSRASHKSASWLLKTAGCGALIGCSLQAQGPIFIPGQHSNGSGGGGPVTFSTLSLVLSGGTTPIFVPIGGGGLGSTTEGDVQMKVSAVTTFSNVCTSLSTAPGVGNALLISLRDNGVSTAVSMTVTDNNKVACDTVHTFTNAAGDFMDWELTPGQVIALFTPDVNIYGQAGSVTGAGVTSIATSCGISGGTITTTGTVSRVPTVNAQAGASYAILTGDCGHTVELTNATPTPTIAAAGSAGFPAGWFTDLYCANACTLTPTTSTINGSANLGLNAKGSARIISDGANYQALLGNGSGGGGSVSFAQPYATDSVNFFAPIFQSVKPLDTTWINQTTATLTVTNGSKFLDKPNVAGHDDVACRVLAIPGAPTPYTLSLGYTISMMGGTGGSGGYAAVVDGTGKQSMIGHILIGGGTQSFSTFIAHVTTPSTNFGAAANFTGTVTLGPQWLRIQDDGTNLFYYQSPDGINYMQVATESDIGFMAIATQAGFCLENFGASFDAGMTVFHMTLTTP